MCCICYGIIRKIQLRIQIIIFFLLYSKIDFLISRQKLIHNAYNVHIKVRPMDAQLLKHATYSEFQTLPLQLIIVIIVVDNGL